MVIRYVNSTKGLNFVMGTEALPFLETYTDVDRAGDTKARRSTTSNLFLLLTESNTVDHPSLSGVVYN